MKHTTVKRTTILNTPSYSVMSYSVTTRPSYHVRKLVHAHAVGLDALISQDVVDQDPAAGGEPDVFTMGILLK